MADPGHGPGEPGGHGPPLIFRQKRGPKGRKNVGGTTPLSPPPEKILDDRTSPLSQGLDTTLLDVMFWACGMF